MRQTHQYMTARPLYFGGGANVPIDRAVGGHIDAGACRPSRRANDRCVGGGCRAFGRRCHPFDTRDSGRWRVGGIVNVARADPAPVILGDMTGRFLRLADRSSHTQEGISTAEGRIRFRAHRNAPLVL